MLYSEQVAAVLVALQRVMIEKKLWSNEEIDSKALLSQQPFCVDTMNFNQWLQFVFIPRMNILLDTQQALPQLVKGQGIEPMAIEYYKHSDSNHSLLMLIRQLDELLQEKGN